MAGNKPGGLAYDLSLFEPEAARKHYKDEAKKGNADSKVIKLENDASERVHKRKRNPVIIFGVAVLMAVVTAICGMILYNDVVINELNEKILDANQTIANQENLNAQYQLKIDRKLTDGIVKDYAENKLGMTRANAAQKEFVSLADGDKAEVIRDDEHETFLSRLAKFFNIS